MDAYNKRKMNIKIFLIYKKIFEFFVEKKGRKEKKRKYEEHLVTFLLPFDV